MKAVILREVRKHVFEKIGTLGITGDEAVEIFTLYLNGNMTAKDVDEHFYNKWLLSQENVTPGEHIIWYDL